MNIFIIGFMGSGKSSLAQRLSNILNLNFIDIDEEIENLSDLKISEIFQQKGEDEFRNIERQCLLNIINTDNNIIATGGGTPCFFDNMDVINKNGVSIYLKMTPAQLFRRLKNSKTPRPLVKELNYFQLKETIIYMLSKREKFYSQANYIVDGKNIDIKQIISFLNIDQSR